MKTFIKTLLVAVTILFLCLRYGETSKTAKQHQIR